MIQLVTSERGIGGFAFPAYNGEPSAVLLEGQPVMRRHVLDYPGAVMHPIGACGLGEFAGILQSKLNNDHNGDMSSAKMVVEGEVKATIYVHATPANYIAGAQLAPFWDSTNGAYLKEVSYQTGITLLQDWTAKEASTLYSQASGNGAWVEIQAQVQHRSGLNHYAWPGLLAADVDYYKVGQATSGSATTVVTSFLNSGTPDFARNVTVTPGGTTTDVAAGDITVVGLDIYGAVLTETIAITANASTIVSGVKAFASLTSVTFPIQDGAGATYDIGTGQALGLGRMFGVKPGVMQAKANAVLEATLPTTVVDPNEIAKNTIAFNTVANATLREAWICPN